MNINSTVGSQIRLYRKKRGLSLEQLAGKIYKSKSVVSKYELGQSNIDIATLQEIADALQIDIRYLLDSPSRPAAAVSARRFGIFTEQRLYLYIMEQMKKKTYLHCGLLSFSDDKKGGTQAVLYMDIPDPDNYQKCTTVYTGQLLCTPYTATLYLANPLDEADQVCILSTVSRSSRRAAAGLYHSYTLVDSLPVTTNLILSKEPIAQEEPLLHALFFEKDQLTMLKRGNIYKSKDYVDASALFAEK